MPADIELVTEGKRLINQLRAHTRKMRLLSQEDAKQTRGLIYKQTGKFGHVLAETEEKIAALNIEFDKIKGEEV